MSSFQNDPYRPQGYGTPDVAAEEYQAPALPGDPSSYPLGAPTQTQSIPGTGGPTGGAAGRAKEAAASVGGPAADVKDTAAAAGRDVLETARAEGAQVVDEAKVQGRRLLDESVSELRTQASTVQSRLADTVQALSDELRAMAGAPDANGPVTSLAQSGQDLGDRAAAWLRDNDLDQAMAGVRRYAARNPWTFLAIAGGAGLLVGRLARGLKDADSDQPYARTGLRAAEPAQPFARTGVEDYPRYDQPPARASAEDLRYDQPHAGASTEDLRYDQPYARAGEQTRGRSSEEPLVREERWGDA